MTVKNYTKANGLSKRINEVPGEIYDIKGPMGKGLLIKKQGVHIAFTAGTGVLVFLDLVAHLARKAFGEVSPEEDS